MVAFNIPRTTTDQRLAVFQAPERVGWRLPAVGTAAASGNSGGSGCVLRTRPETHDPDHLPGQPSSPAADLRPNKADGSQSPGHHQLQQMHPDMQLCLTNQGRGCSSVHNYLYRDQAIKESALGGFIAAIRAASSSPSGSFSSFYELV